MELKFVEAISDEGNWGKFAVGRHETSEWREREAIRPDDLPEGATTPGLLRGRGWGPEHVWILDLQTGEGAMFRPGGHARADLSKRQIWVCPLFEPFLVAFYEHVRRFQDLGWWEQLPRVMRLTGVPLQLRGYRRRGRLDRVEAAVKLRRARRRRRQRDSRVVWAAGR